MVFSSCLGFFLSISCHGCSNQDSWTKCCVPHADKFVTWFCCWKVSYILLPKQSKSHYLISIRPYIRAFAYLQYGLHFNFPDEIRPLDVGLDNEAQIARNWNSSTRQPNGRRGRNGANQFTPPIKYLHIHECKSFSVRYFVSLLNIYINYYVRLKQVYDYSFCVSLHSHVLN